MKSETVSGLGIALALALMAGALLSVWLIGAERLFILAALLIGGLVVAGIIAASAFAIRAYRKTDNPPVIEKHVYHEGRQIIRERVIDGRQVTAPEVKLLQLPAQAQGGAFLSYSALLTRPERCAARPRGADRGRDPRA